MGKAAAHLVTTLRAWALPLRGDLGRTGQRESQETKRKHKGAMTHRWPRVERKGRCTEWWAGCWSCGLASEEPGLRAPPQRHTGHGAECGMFQVKRQLLLNLDGLEQPSNFTLAQVLTSSPGSPSTGWLVPGEQTSCLEHPFLVLEPAVLNRWDMGSLERSPALGKSSPGSSIAQGAIPWASFTSLDTGVLICRMERCDGSSRDIVASKAVESLRTQFVPSWPR